MSPEQIEAIKELTKAINQIDLILSNVVKQIFINPGSKI